MCTTWRSIRRSAGIAGLSGALALQGCASTTEFTRPGTDPMQMKADVHACAQWDAPVVGAVGGAGMGAVAGVAAAGSGATDRDAAIVAGVFALIYGLAYGISLATEDATNYDRCMVARGYRPV